MLFKYSCLVILLGILISSCIQPQEKNQLDLIEDVNNKTPTTQNNHTIKEPKIVKNMSLADNKSLTIAKTEYKKGENIEAIFIFEGELFIHPYIRIFKFENETWNFLGFWDFNGIQYIGYGIIPSCSKYDSSKISPLLIKWDQKVTEEPLPVSPGKNITKKQVDSGKYKIRVVYGDQSVCTDGIDAEFLIK